MGKLLTVFHKLVCMSRYFCRKERMAVKFFSDNIRETSNVHKSSEWVDIASNLALKTAFFTDTGLMPFFALRDGSPA